MKEVISAWLSLGRRGRQLVWLALLIGLIGLLGLVHATSDYFAVTVPTGGGELREGLVGSPRFINPLLAISDADRDLATLVYSGLMRINATGEPIPDLAANYEMSPDGLTYTFQLRPNLVWHDGQTLSADDVIFSVEAAQDPAVKSVKRASWEGVKAERVDNLTVRFHLKQPYPSFLETATMGLLPKHIWSKFDREAFSLNQFNTESVGSGPYRIKAIKKDALGIPEYYDLEPFSGFALGAPKIARLRLQFYSNEMELLNAFRRGEIAAAAAVSADSAKALEATGQRIIRTPLPRIFGIFFNQNKAPVLASAEVRQALALVLDRQAIIDQALRGYGRPATGPLPETIATSASSATSSAPAAGLVLAKNLLTEHGWRWNESTERWEKKTKKETTTLTVSLATADTPELKQAAELVAKAWQALGVPTTLKVFEIGDLNQNVIRPRQYEALFFGEILGRRPDPFAFWHSSQRLDPGLNIALYVNAKADKWLEEARATIDESRRQELYQQFASAIKADTPAIFLYQPEFLYLLPDTIKNVDLPPLNTTSERFLTIYQWYSQTSRVWPIFNFQ